MFVLSLAAGCHEGSSSVGRTVASSSIGPEGGVVTVADGPQAGMRIEVPPGAVVTPTTFTVVELSAQVPPALQGQATEPVVGLPFRIEPDGVVMGAHVTVRVPYLAGATVATAPGNVRVHQVSAYATRNIDPVRVEVLEQSVEFRTLTFGRFQVQQGPVAGGLVEYLQGVGQPVELDGGYQFVRGPGAPPEFSGEALQRWRLTGNGEVYELVFDDESIVGRAWPGVWSEVWSSPASPFLSLAEGGFSLQARTAQLYAPSLGYMQFVSVQMLGYYQFGLPRDFAGTQWRDVLELVVDVDYEWTAGLIESRVLVFQFARGLGLLSVNVDGQRLNRVP